MAEQQGAAIPVLPVTDTLRLCSLDGTSHTVPRDMLRQIKRGKQMVVGFISDQHPLHTDEGHVIKFLNHPTAMISGSEVIARRLGLSVMYFDMRRDGLCGRGHVRMPQGALPPGAEEGADESVRRREL